MKPPNNTADVIVIGGGLPGAVSPSSFSKKIMWVVTRLV
jgi:monoamine oxidase